MPLRWNLYSPAKPSEVSGSIQNWSYGLHFSSSLAEVCCWHFGGNLLCSLGNLNREHPVGRECKEESEEQHAGHFFSPLRPGLGLPNPALNSLCS